MFACRTKRNAEASEAVVLEVSDVVVVMVCEAPESVLIWL